MSGAEILSAGAVATIAIRAASPMEKVYPRPVEAWQEDVARLAASHERLRAHAAKLEKMLAPPP